MVLTDREDNICVAETDEELLTFDVSDDALERAGPIVGGQATPVTLSGLANTVGAGYRSGLRRPRRRKGVALGDRDSDVVWKNPRKISGATINKISTL